MLPLGHHPTYLARRRPARTPSITDITAEGKSCIVIVRSNLYQAASVRKRPQALAPRPAPASALFALCSCNIERSPYRWPLCDTEPHRLQHSGLTAGSPAPEANTVSTPLFKHFNSAQPHNRASSEARSDFGVRRRREHRANAALAVRLGAPRSHRHKLLGGGGMDGHRVVKVGLGGAHLEGDAEALQHLICGDADDVQPNHPLLLAGAHELHGHRLLGLLVAQREVHRLEDRLVHGDRLLAVHLLSMRLCHPDDADGRVREDHSRDIAVLEPGVGGAAEQPIRQPAARSDGDRGELIAGGGGVA
eukprot:scaffold12646_cov115-Isochrysis_galbana.AAC.1